MIRKVFVIHKTHLDIGFTDSAASVLEKYVNTFIPGAIETAYACNTDGKKNFVWTVGAFLIEYYLEHSEHPESLLRAIRDGYITWHGLALTTHTELMDERLFRYELDIARRLDLRFGKQTISAKMTDVPCHTHAMVPYLAEYGIQYLHIGINEASRPVELPPLCRLRYGDAEVILHYAGAYGGADTFGEYALEFAHTADNMGPPSPEHVRAEMARLRQKYPGAEIVSATMDDFAREVLKQKDLLPVVTEELGDTWIHGVATDPYKVGAYCALLRVRDQWLSQRPGAEHSPEYREFSRNLMLLCEHTWGRDSKRWFSDYKNWSKEDFRAARKRDLVTAEDTLPAGELISRSAVQQPTFRRGDCRYSNLEASWQEQREYVDAAAAALPEPWRTEARHPLAALRPSAPPCPRSSDSRRDFLINGYRAEVQPDGSLRVSREETGQKLLLGRLVYRVYGWKTVQENFAFYNRDLERTRVWAEPDFSKPGLDTLRDLEDGTYFYEAEQAERQGSALRVWLKAPREASERFGAPRRAVVTYQFGSGIDMNLQWFGKDASRIPEALFLTMNAEGAAPGKLTLYKLCLPVDPFRVRRGGNRKLHVSPRFTWGKVTVESLHAPLLSVGGEHLYDVDDRYGSLNQGLSYVLFNNRWDTNFRLWYEENASFDFKVHWQD